MENELLTFFSSLKDQSSDALLKDARDHIQAAIIRAHNDNPLGRVRAALLLLSVVERRFERTYGPQE